MKCKAFSTRGKKRKQCAEGGLEGHQHSEEQKTPCCRGKGGMVPAGNIRGTAAAGGSIDRLQARLGQTRGKVKRGGSLNRRKIKKGGKMRGKIYSEERRKIGKKGGEGLRYRRY